MDAVIIFDEVLAEALELPRDRHAFDEALNRQEPDPFGNIWEELRAYFL